MCGSLLNNGVRKETQETSQKKKKSEEQACPKIGDDRGRVREETLFVEEGRGGQRRDSRTCDMNPHEA